MFLNWETHAPQLGNTCASIGKHMRLNWETHAPQLRNMCTAIEKRDAEACIQEI